MVVILTRIGKKSQSHLPVKAFSHVYKHCSIIILESLEANFLQSTSLTLSDAMSSLEFNCTLFQ